jgi:hypothetical protein
VSLPGNISFYAQHIYFQRFLCEVGCAEVKSCITQGASAVVHEILLPVTLVFI